MTPQRWGASFAILSLLLAACDKREPKPAPSALTAAPNEITPADIRVSDPRILVDSKGLSNGGRGLRTSVPFGAPRGEVDRLAVEAMGLPASRSASEECGAGPMEFTEIGPLQIAYQDGVFVGWYLTKGGPIVTSDGVSPGLALAQLKEWRPVRVIPDSTLEGEFEYRARDGGLITGFFEGPEPEGEIVALQAGVSCFFR